MARLRWSNPHRDKPWRGRPDLSKWRNSKPIPGFEMDEKITFGKYRGHTPRQLKKTDPKYLYECERTKTFYVYTRIDPNKS